MVLSPKTAFGLEVYKCVVLTVIAALLLSLLQRSPYPANVSNILAKRVKATEIPIVRVSGGQLEVEVTNTVDVTGSVELNR